MKFEITKLVVLFNKDKITIGVIVSIISFVMSFFTLSPLSEFLIALSGLIILNIVAAIIASYILYDKSELYKPKELFKNLKIEKEDKAILLHASFDPISKELEKMFSDRNLKVYNIYGNRHEHESAIKISEQIFLPNKRDIKIDPKNFPDENDTFDYLFAITSIHEILTHKERVQFFKEAKRILKPDGALIVCEQMRDLVNFLFFNFGFLHFVSMNDWIKAINEAGMKVESKKGLTPFAKVLYVRAK